MPKTKNPRLKLKNTPDCSIPPLVPDGSLTHSRQTLPHADLVNIFKLFIPQLLSYPNPTDPLNGEAAALLMRDPEAYKNRIRECVRLHASDPVHLDGTPVVIVTDASASNSSGSGSGSGSGDDSDSADDKATATGANGINVNEDVNGKKKEGGGSSGDAAGAGDDKRRDSTSADGTRSSSSSDFMMMQVGLLCLPSDDMICT